MTGTDEVVRICHDLLRIDTTNTGDLATTAGERAAAEYVAAQLAEVGIESAVPGERAGPGQPGRPHPGHRPGPAGAAGPRPPRRGAGRRRRVVGRTRSRARCKDGYLWGRGAIDMKDFDAMMLAVVRQWQREGSARRATSCSRFLADEEAGSDYGAHYLVDTEPELFEGCTEAIGEVGGFSFTVGSDQRLYLIETAEKGIDWLRLHAKGRPGHGSMINDDNAVTALSEAVARVGRHRFPIVMTPTVRAFLERGVGGPRHRARPGRPGGDDRQAGPDRRDHRRHDPQHREPDPAARRLQGQRHPEHGDGDDRLPHPARPVRPVPGAAPGRRRPGHRDRDRPAPAGRWRPRSTAPWWRR